MLTTKRNVNKNKSSTGVDFDLKRLQLNKLSILMGEEEAIPAPELPHGRHGEETPSRLFLRGFATNLENGVKVSPTNSQVRRSPRLKRRRENHQRDGGSPVRGGGGGGSASFASFDERDDVLEDGEDFGQVVVAVGLRVAASGERVQVVDENDVCESRK